MKKTEELIEGFTNGFDLGYRGTKQRCDYAENIPLRIGSKTELWNKIMKEVELGRYAGLYDEVPYENFIQSPVGLVPKAGKNKTRLIFHLSYEFGDRGSVNSTTPKDICTVKYRDLDHAVKCCLDVLNQQKPGKNGKKTVRFSKSDLTSAFRILPMKTSHHCWLDLMAEDPLMGKKQFFVDKCLQFGASISCA